MGGDLGGDFVKGKVVDPRPNEGFEFRVCVDPCWASRPVLTSVFRRCLGDPFRRFIGGLNGAFKGAFKGLTRADMACASRR